LIKIKFVVINFQEKIIKLYNRIKTDTGKLIEYIKMKKNNIEGTRQIDSVTSGERVPFLSN
jgi:hypothetical protein